MVEIAAILVIVFAVLFLAVPVFRCAVCHPVLFSFYGVLDLFHYIAHKEYNHLGTGQLIAYTGLFGKGKTLSAVHKVVQSYRRYNGKKVWCPRRKKIVTQRVHIISNVALSVPYEDFRSLSQVVHAAHAQRAYDNDNDTLTCTLVLGDEFSVQLNSRKFKENIDPLFLNALLTCRHYYISIYYTSQRFGHVDALLRQVTSSVVECNKVWRFQMQNMFDAWDLENSGNPRLVQPLARSCWFVRDRDYKAYDTLATVGNLEKSCKEGDMMTEAEILCLILKPGN